MTAFAGSTTAFALAVATIVVWAVTGLLFRYTDTWQLVINTNTGTTIVTFLMVFLIQRTQDKNALAIQLKLNEIVAAIDGASNRLINVEDLTESELQILSEHDHRLAEMAKNERQIGGSRSVEEARVRHERKRGVREGRPCARDGVAIRCGDARTRNDGPVV